MRMRIPAILSFLICSTSLAKSRYPIVTGSQRSHILATIARAEKYHNLPTGLLRSIISIESAFYPQAYNSHLNPGVAISSYGLGQLTSDTAWSHCRLAGAAVYNVFKNVYCSAKVLKFYLLRHNKNVNQAVAAYNWGSPCECNGYYYVKLNFGTACRRRKKPILCRGKGTFLNQVYVDKVFGYFLRYNGIGGADDDDLEDEISYYERSGKILLTKKSL